jgi:hypothetical protein
MKRRVLYRVEFSLTSEFRPGKWWLAKEMAEFHC